MRSRQELPLIARCPDCQTRFRIAREKIGPQGARIRCSKCETVFRVQAPPPEPIVDAELSHPGEIPTPAPPLAHVLIAEGDAGTAKAIADLLTSRRISSDIVTSGGEALLRLFRQPPDAALLGGHLPGVLATAVCEIVRRSGALGKLPLVRVAPMDEPAGAPEFEADATVEPGDLPQGLTAIFDKLGLGAAQSPAPAPSPAEKAAAAERRVSDRRSEKEGEPPTAPSMARVRPPTSDDPDVAKAERLARITVSDIILYNEEKFAEAAAAGNVADAFQVELGEARQHFDSKVPEAVRGRCDFLVAELERRAEARNTG